MAGKIVHLEIPAGETARGTEFYSSLFGWQFQAMEGPVEYHMTSLTEDTGAGLYPRQGEERGLVVYFDTDDCDSAAARVRELGGEAEEKMPVPGMGWFARCVDTEGNPFGLWQADPSAAPPQ